MFSKQLFPRRALQFPLRSLQTHSHRDFSIGYGLRQTQGKTNSQVISEVAREEGGPSKGSASAQLQSQASKERNNQQTQRNPESQMISEVAREEGGTSKGSASAQLQSQVTKARNSQQTQGNTDSQVISEVARQEGGTSKGSTSAQLQSQVTKARNNQQTQGNTQQTQGNNQQTQGKTDSQVISEVARQEGGPSKGSASAQLQSQVAKQNNQQGTAELGSTLEQNSSTSRGTGGTAPQAQSDRLANYEDVASKVQEKIATDPASVTPEDGNLARSRETRAFGATEKGGVAAKAQSLGSENVKAGRV